MYFVAKNVNFNTTSSPEQFLEIALAPNDSAENVYFRFVNCKIIEINLYNAVNFL